MWIPRLYQAPADKIINLQVCELREGLKVSYVIKGIGAQPPNAKLIMWLTCPLSKQKFNMFMKRKARTVEMLAYSLYEEHRARKKILEAEKKEIETENQLEQICSMFED